VLRQFARSPRGIAVIAVFGLGIALRIAFLIVYRPAFLGDADSGTYIFTAAHGLFSNVYDPAGFPLIIRVLHWVYPHLTLLILAQHALGVLSALLLYLIVRRTTGSTVLGLLPAAIVLLDGYGVWVEHTPLTEPWFSFLIVCVLYLSIRAADGEMHSAALAGVLIGLAGTIRPVGYVLVPLVAAWLLWVYPGSGRTRMLALLAVLAPALLIGAGYVEIQRSQTGFTGLTRDSGRVLYARAAGFADCSRFTPPAGTGKLCEKTPSSQRGSFNQYLTGYPDGAAGVTEAQRSISPAWRVFGPPPAGNAKLQAFGEAAILHQPLDYLKSVAEDFRHYWADHHRKFIDADARIDPNVEQTVSSYYGTPGVHSDGLGFLRWYGEWIEITGVLMIALLVAPLIGLLPGERTARRAAILLACTGWLLPLASDAFASVDPRFILPAYGPLAAAVAIGLRSPSLSRRSRFRSGRCTSTSRES
jgi:hypothetical protein